MRVWLRGLTSAQQKTCGAGEGAEASWSQAADLSNRRAPTSLCEMGGQKGPGAGHVENRWAPGFERGEGTLLYPGKGLPRGLGVHVR